MTRPRLFVHIPSYRDRECQWTVRDLFDQARHPDRIAVGICWQTDPDHDRDCFTLETRPDQVRTRHFRLEQAQGVGWARQQAQSLWQGEEYSLQIDSHMRFVTGWDELLLDQLAACDAPDPVLTVYPPAYFPPDRRIDPPRPLIQRIQGFAPNGLLDFTASPLPADAPHDRPLPTAACAGGFLFGPSRILRDVPYDPDIYFNGEEPSLALRLWTHGFDLFSPSRTILYHYYGRHDGARHWDDATGWNQQHRTTLRRMRALCDPANAPPADIAALGRFGPGTARSLADYERFSGVDFAGRTLADYARAFPFVRPTHPAALPSEALRPAADARTFLLGDDALVFQQSSGTFYRLNPAAAFAWVAREEGDDWAQIAAEQADARAIPPARAQQDLATLAAHWHGQKLLLGPGEYPSAPPGSPRHGPCLDPAHFDFKTRAYRLLDATMTVRYGDRDLEARIHPTIAHLECHHVTPVAETFTLVGLLDWVYLFQADTLLLHGDDPAALAPRLKFQLLTAAVAHCRPILQLHAGAVAWAGRLVLLPGQSGDGKTSLTARLVADGATYFSDEAVLIERGTTRVRPLPISLCVKARAMPLLAPLFPGLADLPEHHREDGLDVRYLPPPATSLPPSGHAAEPRLVVFRHYQPGAAQRLRPLPPAEAFGRLMHHCAAIPKPLDTDDAAALVGFAQRLACWELTGSDLADDAQKIRRLCEQTAPD